MSERRKITAADSRKSLGRAKPNVIMPVPDTLAGMPANIAMVLMYWDIGQYILQRQQQEGWGAKVIDRLSHDLKTTFPDMTGFSPRNLKYMREFAESWQDRVIVQRTVAQLPWRSNLMNNGKLIVENEK